jgi:hypothetical protein
VLSPIIFVLNILNSLQHTAVIAAVVLIIIGVTMGSALLSPSSRWSRCVARPALATESFVGGDPSSSSFLEAGQGCVHFILPGPQLPCKLPTDQAKQFVHFKMKREPDVLQDCAQGEPWNTVSQAASV